MRRDRQSPVRPLLLAERPKTEPAEIPADGRQGRGAAARMSDGSGRGMHFVRRGAGPPLLMLHGLGGSHRSWSTIEPDLAMQRELILLDLPGFGDSAPLPGETSIPTLADAVTGFMHDHGLEGVDMVGSSMGARLALELARRRVAGAVVSLDPGGFWSGVEKPVFETSIRASIKLVRGLQPVMPALTGSPAGRTLLFAQFSAKPWRLPAKETLTEMRDYARATRFDELLHSLVHGPEQQGMIEPPRPITIGWGRQDRVCFPSQAQRAIVLFPMARLHWFERCGHFPHWDQPAQTVRLILEGTS
jgi:pimeloyl-ACP methyl ester carboxylesterase